MRDDSFRKRLKRREDMFLRRLFGILAKMAKADGCKASVLFVWDHNPAGLSLYKECGYVPGAREEGGAYMKKKL